MPKRKKPNSQRAQQRAEAKALNASQNSQKKPPKQKKRPSQSQSQPQPPTLGSRFNSLHPELRAEIFAWLLSGPEKWQATHKQSCPLNNPAKTPSPFQDIRPRQSPSKATCAEYSNTPKTWRSNKLPIWQDPWRSAWAPKIRNEYLCSACWDNANRNHPSPQTDNLPCLCARTRDLSVRLVCKSWYNEASRVLYTRNTLSFSTPQECTAFFNALNPRWANIVSKVSLLSPHAVGKPPKSAAEDLETKTFDARQLREALGTLSKLPSLGKLELDAIYLTNPAYVHVLRWATLRNLRSLTFTQSPVLSPEDAPREFVWPRQALRVEIDRTDFTVDVARGLKGDRYGWKKGRNTGDEQAVSEERVRYLTRFKHNGSIVRHDEDWER